MSKPSATLEAPTLIPSLLTAHDRCDRCPAQAVVEVVLQSGNLIFCGHHFNKAEEKLRALSPTVFDHRS